MNLVMLTACCAGGLRAYGVVARTLAGSSLVMG
jgi:hypothetical protein